MITIISILIALLLPAIQAAREAARRSSCSNNLRQLGIALQTYHDVCRRFPPGAHLHTTPNQRSISWRVMILPQLEENVMYQRIDPTPDGGATNWDSEEVAVSPYLCPSAEPPTTRLKPSQYSGVMGPGRGDYRMNLTGSCGDVFTDGMFFPGSRTRIAKIEDGTSHTLAVGERVYQVIWPWVDGATANSAGGVSATRICTNAMSNIKYPLNAKPDEFGYYVGDFDAPDPALKKIPLNDLYFASLHTGGAQFCYADGSVHMLSEAIDFTVFGDMSTIAGGEVPTAPP